MDLLRGRAAVRTGKQLGRAADLEVDASPHGIELNLSDLPWSNQTQCTREQPLDAKAHATFDLNNSTPTRGHMDKPLRALPTCPPAPTTTSNCECWIPHESTRGPSVVKRFGLPFAHRN